jgi:hypothetical protein
MIAAVLLVLYAREAQRAVDSWSAAATVRHTENAYYLLLGGLLAAMLEGCAAALTLLEVYGV